MNRLLKIFWRWILLLALLVALVYAGEDLLLRYRWAHSGPAAVFDRVTTYEAGEIKGGKLEYYFDQPGVEVCVRALFPHFGGAPCWYARRHTIKVLSRACPNVPPAARTNGCEPQGARSSRLDVIWIAGRSERYTGHFGANMPWTRSIVSRFSSPAAITNAT
jgi:hypothetical protein